MEVALYPFRDTIMDSTLSSLMFRPVGHRHAAAVADVEHQMVAWSPLVPGGVSG